MAFGELTNTVDEQIPGVRIAVEYMVWPNCFEPAASQNHRKMRTDLMGGREAVKAAWTRLLLPRT